MIDIEQKSDGLIGVITGLMALEQVMARAQFEMFCENVPDGEVLWDMLNDRRGAPDTPEAFGWPEFALEVIKANSHKYMTPQSCILPEAALKGHIVGIALQKMAESGEQMTDTEMLAAHREEQPALDKMRRFLCGSCNLSSCPWYMKKKPYSQMTDDEVRNAIKGFCMGNPSEDQVKQRIRDELGYDGTPAITSTSTTSSGMTMSMFMVMLNGPSGKILLI